jgi:hypothetical protein
MNNDQRRTNVSLSKHGTWELRDKYLTTRVAQGDLDKLKALAEAAEISESSALRMLIRTANADQLKKAVEKTRRHAERKVL